MLGATQSSDAFATESLEDEFRVLYRGPGTWYLGLVGIFGA